MPAINKSRITLSESIRPQRIGEATDYSYLKVYVDGSETNFYTISPSNGSLITNENLIQENGVAYRNIIVSINGVGFTTVKQTIYRPTEISIYGEPLVSLDRFSTYNEEYAKELFFWYSRIEIVFENDYAVYLQAETDNFSITFHNAWEDGERITDTENKEALLSGSYFGYSFQEDVEIEVVQVSVVDITFAGLSESYRYRESVGLSANQSVGITYENGWTASVNLGTCEINKPYDKQLTKRDTELVITYAGFSKSFPINVITAESATISLGKNTYFKGENFSKEGIQASVTYSDGSVETISDESKFFIVGFSSYETGWKTCNASVVDDYGESINSTVTYQVIEDSYVSIEPSQVKSVYFYGEVFDGSSDTFLLTKASGETETITGDRLAVSTITNGTTIKSDSKITNTVYYGSVSTSYDINIKKISDVNVTWSHGVLWDDEEINVENLSAKATITSTDQSVSPEEIDISQYAKNAINNAEIKAGYNSVDFTYSNGYQSVTETITIYVAHNGNYISVPSSLTLPFGNKAENYAKYINPVVKKVKDNSVVNDAVVSIIGGSGIILQSTDLTLKCDDADDVVIYGSAITWESPEILEIIPNIKKGFYLNQVDSVDLTDSSFLVKYGYESDEVDFTTTADEYADSLSDFNEYEITAPSSFGDNSFDGSSIVEISSQEDTSDFQFSAKVRSYFDITETQSVSFNIIISQIESVTGIEIVRAFTEYKVGQRFLDEEIERDDNCTKIAIWYKETDDYKSKKFIVDLKKAPSIIETSIKKGYTFSEEESQKEIIVSSVFAYQGYKPTASYSISVGSYYSYDHENPTKTHTLRAFNSGTVIYRGRRVASLNGSTWILVSSEDKQALKTQQKILRPTNIAGNNVYIIEQSEGNFFIGNVQVYGYIEGAFSKSTNARIHLFSTYEPEQFGEGNITVTYPCYDEKTAEDINKCHFGHLFGANNAKNRLFLSGNESSRNFDWHSSEVDPTRYDVNEGNKNINGDFSYFSDIGYMSYGQSDNAVVGYDIVSDSRLAVFKTKSDKEPTIYYLTAGTSIAYDSAGNQIAGIDNSYAYQEQYTLEQGNVGESATSQKGIANFNGDTLFISSDKHINGLDLVGIQGNSKRIASTRSAFLDNRLKEKDLSSAYLWTDQQYLYLVLEDMAYITHFSKVSEGQYEWWAVDTAGMSCIFSFNNKTYYGTRDGKVALLDNGIYEDIKCAYSDSASLDNQNKKVTIESSVVNAMDKSKEHYIVFPFSGAGLKQFKLVSSNGGNPTEQDYQNCSFYLSKGYDSEGSVFDNSIDVNQISTSATSTHKVAIITKEPVKAYYITAPNTMGDIMSDKNVWAWTLTNDTNIGSSVDVCYVTNSEGLDSMKAMAGIAKGNYGFSYDSVDYGSISFDRFVTPYKYTYYRPLTRVPFICFGFRSNEATNSVLCALQVTYSVGFQSFGDK